MKMLNPQVTSEPPKQRRKSGSKGKTLDTGRGSGVARIDLGNLRGRMKHEPSNALLYTGRRRTCKSPPIRYFSSNARRRNSPSEWTQKRSHPAR